MLAAVAVKLVVVVTVVVVVVVVVVVGAVVVVIVVAAVTMTKITVGMVKMCQLHQYVTCVSMLMQCAM